MAISQHTSWQHGGVMVSYGISAVASLASYGVLYIRISHDVSQLIMHTPAVHSTTTIFTVYTIYGTRVATSSSRLVLL